MSSVVNFAPPYREPVRWDRMTYKDALLGQETVLDENENIVSSVRASAEDNGSSSSFKTVNTAQGNQSEKNNSSCNIGKQDSSKAGSEKGFTFEEFINKFQEVENCRGRIGRGRFRYQPEEQRSNNTYYSRRQHQGRHRKYYGRGWQNPQGFSYRPPRASHASYRSTRGSTGYIRRPGRPFNSRSSYRGYWPRRAFFTGHHGDSNYFKSAGSRSRYISVSSQTENLQEEKVNEETITDNINESLVNSGCEVLEKSERKASVASVVSDHIHSESYIDSSDMESDIEIFIDSSAFTYDQRKHISI